MIVQSHHLNEETTNKRVVYWLLDINANIGDEVILSDYVEWVEDNLFQFKHELKVRSEMKLSEIPFGQQLFDTYLSSKVNLSGKDLNLQYGRIK